MQDYNSQQFELEIRQVLSQYSGGANIVEIEAGLSSTINRRTLQRWLNRLIEQNLIQRTGKARATKYSLISRDTPKSYNSFNYSVNHDSYQVGVVAESAVIKQEPPKNTNQIKLSFVAQEIERQVRLPLNQKTPVGYNTSFLDSYIPNQTFYLNDEIRQQLFAEGKAVNVVEPAGTYARQLSSRLLIDLSWNSSRLEGNTYSLLETERLLSAGEISDGRYDFETKMILNHKAAIEFLIESAEDVGFNNYTIFNLHSLLAEGLLPDARAMGRIRTIPVGIGQTVFLPLDAPQILEEHFNKALIKAQAIADPFEQAFFIMVHLPYLQPFEDVNKRVSRLAANIPFIKHNLCPLSFVGVPQETYISGLLGVYELNKIDLLREVFVWAYRRSCQLYSTVRQTLGEPDRFKMQYREIVFETVHQIIKKVLDKPQAIKFIAVQSQQVIEADRNQFIEVVDTELLSLHEGNIARYKVRPMEYYQWKQVFG